MHVSRDVDVRVSGVTESEPDGRTGVIFTDNLLSCAVPTVAFVIFELESRRPQRKNQIFMFTIRGTMCC